MSGRPECQAGPLAALLCALAACQPIAIENAGLLDDNAPCVVSAACRSARCEAGRCVPGWPSGALGDVHLRSGETWSVPAGSVLDLASLTIDEGARLQVVPVETMRWTFIGVQGRLALAGEISAQGDPSVGGTIESPLRIVATAPGTGELLEHLLMQARGGDGGDGGHACLSARCDTTPWVTGGSGGHGAFGNGGGGGAGGYWAGNVTIDGHGKNGDDASPSGGGQGGATILSDGSRGGAPGNNGVPAGAAPFNEVPKGAPGAGGGGGGRGLHGMPLYLFAVEVSVSGLGTVDVSGLGGGAGGQGGLGGYKDGAKPDDGPASGNGGGGGGGAGGSGGAIVIRTSSPPRPLLATNVLRYSGGESGDAGVQPTTSDHGAAPLVHSGPPSAVTAKAGQSGPPPDIREP